MPRETRAIFLRRQQGRLGRGLTDREYIREWSQKSALQKEQWVTIYDQLTDQGNVANAAQAEWNAANADYQGVFNARDDPRLGSHFYPVHLRATTAARNARQAFADLKIRYQTFLALESRQPVPSDESRIRSLIKITACGSKVVQFDNHLAILDRSRSGPETPPDQNL